MTTPEMIATAKQIIADQPGINKRNIVLLVYGPNAKKDPDSLLMMLESNGVLTCEDDAGRITLF